MSTRAERSARNKRAHALRRQMTNQDYADLRRDGTSVRWRDIAAIYDAMSTDEVLAEFDRQATASFVPPVVPARRQAPPHVAEATAEYRLARLAWEAQLADALGGGQAIGDKPRRPTRGEDRRYTEEERVFRERHPSPRFRDFLVDVCARRKNPEPSST